MPPLTTFIQHSMGIPSHNNQTRKRNKMNPNWKGKVKSSLFADDIILYIENSKNTTRKLLELINTFSKVAGYKINIQTSVVFLYTNNGHSGREIKEDLDKWEDIPCLWVGRLNIVKRAILP